MVELTQQSATAGLFKARADLRSAEATVRAAQYSVRAEKSQRFPAFSLHADYGGAGVNVGSFNSVYTVAGSVSFPDLTGGRIRADVDEARANLTRRQGEYEDLKGRVAYDVRVAC